MQGKARVAVQKGGLIASLSSVPIAAFAPRGSAVPCLCSLAGIEEMRSGTFAFARWFALSLAMLIHALAPNCSLRLRSPLRPLVRSLAFSFAPEFIGFKDTFMFMN